MDKKREEELNDQIGSSIGQVVGKLFMRVEKLEEGWKRLMEKVQDQNHQITELRKDFKMFMKERK